jgi:hypothetical protein
MKHENLASSMLEFDKLLIEVSLWKIEDGSIVESSYFQQRDFEKRSSTS